MVVPSPSTHLNKISSKNETESRWESDSLGQVEISADALYGIQTARAVACMSFSGATLANYPDLIVFLATVKKACAAANHDAGVLDTNYSEAIQAACDDLIAGLHNDQFPVDMLHGGGSIAFNQNVNEVLTNLANLRLGGRLGDYSPISRQHVNAGQSTADVCHTAMRLFVSMRVEKLLAALTNLRVVLQKKQVEFQDVQTLARTCMQDAMPVSLGTTFGAFETFVSRRFKQLQTAKAQMDSINLGGTVIGDGSGADLRYQLQVPKRLSALVGRELTVAGDRFDSAQHIDDLVDIANELKTLAEGLLKFAKDLRLLSSGPDGGFSEIVLPAMVEGSSFFKGKINPVIPESVIQACMVVIGCARVVESAAEHGELNLNVFDGLAAKSVLDAATILEGAVSIFSEHCVVGIAANRQRCEELAGLGFELKQQSSDGLNKDSSEQI